MQRRRVSRVGGRSLHHHREHAVGLQPVGVVQRLADVRFIADIRPLPILPAAGCCGARKNEFSPREVEASAVSGRFAGIDRVDRPDVVARIDCEPAARAGHIGKNRMPVRQSPARQTNVSGSVVVADILIASMGSEGFHLER